MARGKVPQIAVFLAAYNGISFIHEQIRSILRQKGVDVRLYISVDKSTDGTEEFLFCMAQFEPRIVLLPFGERFGGAGRNFFRLVRDVDFSGFDYVSFSDQDDIWMVDKLSRATAALLKNGADGYSSNVMAFWPNGKKRLIVKSHALVQWDYLFESAGPGCTYVIKSELACDIQRVVKCCWNDIQEVVLHDWFFYAFARANDYKWIIDDYPGLLYRQHRKNQLGVNYGCRAFIFRANKILNGWGFSQSVLIARLVGLGDTSFTRPWSGGRRFGYIWLMLHAGQCRRRFRDKILFSLSCLALFVIGRRDQ